MATALAVGAAVAGCGTASGGSADSTAGAAVSATAPLTLTDGWAKAVEDVPTSSTPSTASATGSAGMSAPMTAMFGTLTNTTGGDLTVTGGSSPVAERVQLHETVKNASGQMQMQQRQGGFVIPEGGTLTLRPGADHVMLMGLTGPLKNGSTVSVTLVTSAGNVVFAVPVRTFTGANETYQARPS
jgi:hypothetical protein